MNSIKITYKLLQSTYVMFMISFAQFQLAQNNYKLDCRGLLLIASIEDVVRLLLVYKITTHRSHLHLLIYQSTILGFHLHVTNFFPYHQQRDQFFE